MAEDREIELSVLDWFISEIGKHIDTSEIPDKIIEEAKTMFNKQIHDAHYYGQESQHFEDTWDDHPEFWASEYFYNKFINKP
jgi:hypothetical protein